MEIGDRLRRHSAAIGAAAIVALAIASVGGLVVAQSRLERLDLDRASAASTTTSTVAPEATPDPAPDALATDLLGEINTARTNAAVSALAADPRLDRNAQRWAQRMADSRDLAHQDLGPVLALGFSSAGETIVSGLPDVDATAVTRSWMQSPPNRSTLVHAAFTHAGVGVARDDTGQVWVALVLAG